MHEHHDTNMTEGDGECRECRRYARDLAERRRTINSQTEELLQLRSKLEQLQKRYTWAANELLACDYGDNDHPSRTVGWRVYGWRDRSGNRRIYGDSIDMAIDIEMRNEPPQ